MDPITISAIAASAVTFLSPYLAKAADSIVPKAAEELYGALRARLTQKPAAAEALHDLEKAPADADAQAALRLQLKKLLGEDAEFAAQLKGLVEEIDRTAPRGGVTATGRGVAAGGNINGPTFTGDIHGGVDIGNSGPPRPARPDEP